MSSLLGSEWRARYSLEVRSTKGSDAEQREAEYGAQRNRAIGYYAHVLVNCTAKRFEHVNIYYSLIILCIVLPFKITTHFSFIRLYIIVVIAIFVIFAIIINLLLIILLRVQRLKSSPSNENQISYRAADEFL